MKVLDEIQPDSESTTSTLLVAPRGPSNTAKSNEQR
jgi:hypothetical protein